jgi:hypothetical protein
MRYDWLDNVAETCDAPVPYMLQGNEVAFKPALDASAEAQDMRGMVWPLPRPDLAFKLVHEPEAMTLKERLTASSVMRCYELSVRKTDRKRNLVLDTLKAAFMERLNAARDAKISPFQGME